MTQLIPLITSPCAALDSASKPNISLPMDIEPALENLRIAQRALSEACDRALSEMARLSELDAIPEAHAKDPTTMETTYERRLNGHKFVIAFKLV